ncbi:Fur family transcriptional regulator [Acinetobacter larvae]|nr:transcriptional repressor [Acinetobacter larvae]
MDIHEDVIQQLRQSGLRATYSRTHILKALLNAKQEVSADHLYRDFAIANNDISLTSIYKTLSELESKKLIRCITLGRNKSFYKINNDFFYCKIISNKDSEIISLDKTVVNKSLKQFIADLGLDIEVESIELVIYKK